MKNRIKLIGLITLFFVAAAFLLWPTNKDEALKVHAEATTLSPKASNIPLVPLQTPGSATPAANPILALLQTPIEFYGIVLDQNGNPVPAAKVTVSVFNNMTKASPLNTISDASGKFMIQSKGMGLRIEITKSGYYYVDAGGELKASTQGFDFGADLGRGVNKSDSSSPIIFHLRKAGNAIPLDRLSANPKVPRDGSPITIGLSKTSKVTLQISCRTMEDSTQPPNAPYDWHCKITSEGGGIQEASDEHSFLAPSDGYTQLALIDMPKTLDPKQWSSRASKSYWLRFADNTFGKVSFMMIARGDHFAVINGFRNPSPNDRNLEPKLDDR
jgi:hypothetical protein